MRRFAMIGVLALVGSMAMPVAAVAAVPPNDDLAAATPVEAISFEDAQEVGDATVEVGEPTETCAPFANTVWYALRLPKAMDVTIDTAGANYDTTIAVWLGTSFDDVELFACNDDTFASLQAAVTIKAEGGVTYLVQVGSFYEAPSDASLTIAFTKGTGKPLIFRDSFRGSLAAASIEDYDELTGDGSYRSVTVIDGRSQGKAASPFMFAEVMVDSFEQSFDPDTETYTSTSWSGLADLDSSDFNIDQKLAEAFVTKDVTMFGYACTESYVGEEPQYECTDLGESEVLVDVHWDGQGAIVRTSDRSADQSGDASFRFRGTSRSRDAVIEGGVLGDRGFDLAAAQGRIAKEASGFWQWSRGGAGGFLGFAAPAMAFVESALAAGMPVVVFDKFRGDFAQVFDEEFNEQTGAFSSREVVLTSGRSQTKGERWLSFDEVLVSSLTGTYDEAAGTRTITQWSGSGPVDESSFGRSLESAAVTAEVALFGVRCVESFDGEPSFECTELSETSVMVDVSWEGLGGTFTSRSSFDGRDGEVHLRFSGRSTSRNAMATGTVYGDEVAWSYNDAQGYLSRDANGSWYKQ